MAAQSVSAGLLRFFENCVLFVTVVPLHPAGETDTDHKGLWFIGYRAAFQGYFQAAAVSAGLVADAIVEQR